MIQWFGAGKVIAFEPMGENFELLRRNRDLLGRDGRIRIFEVALGDVEGRGELQVDDVVSGTAVLDRVTGGKPSEARMQRGLGPKTETVNIVPLDVLIEREELPPPDFVKIDTEGAAGIVLQGGVQTIDRHAPRLVVSLHNTEEAGSVVEQLNGLGYACFGPVNEVASEAYRRLDAADARSINRKYDIVCSRVAEQVNQRVKPLRTVPPPAGRD